MPNPFITDRALALVPALPAEDPAYIQNLPPLHSGEEDPVESAVASLLYALGIDEGDHTAETPKRVAKAWRAQLAGYEEDPAKHLDKQFSAPARPGLVAVHGIRFASTCAHHLLPITGTASIAYRAQDGGDVVGLSKLARVLEGYARRLQVQERIGSQVVEAIAEKLAPVGAVVVLTAEHGCMTVRGVSQPGAATTTIATAGAWDEYHPDVQNTLAVHHNNLR
ncbi:GTP cyclohydrolase I [Arthrobacter phage Sonali]|uniref:GTP cyclohydrolase I n=1 Tax=Arthrobacter phage Sonali TaxID=2510495 RepID=A0A411CR18_9CAUD|nr:GTP cyclohydrolase [Arthrobacter phage Sonali]QAY16203.1 GTP cyclohydrolase I [Arthrobacter phage Sonali]